MKVGETQDVNKGVAKSETDQLTVGESSLMFARSLFVCLICGRRETGMEP